MELEGDELALSGDEGLAAGAAGTAAIPSTSMSQHDFNKQFSMLLQQPPQPGLVLPDNELSASGLILQATAATSHTIMICMC